MEGFVGKRLCFNLCVMSQSDVGKSVSSTDDGMCSSKVVNSTWNIQPSTRSLLTINPIRNLVQNIRVQPNPKLDKLDLSVGDPTVYGNLQPPQNIQNALANIVSSGNSNGYPASFGTLQARESVADLLNRQMNQNGSKNDTFQFTESDVYLTAGTSGALELALSAVANHGDNILVPQPGFPLVQTVAGYLGVDCHRYHLVADKSWEIDLDSIRSAVNERTVALVLNNPSNPCGSVWSRKHVEDVMSLAAELKLLVIADEIYAEMAFNGLEFTSASAVTGCDAPVLVLGGISKRFVVPGWRLGWLAVCDRMKVLENSKLRQALRQLTTRMLLPSKIIQDVLPQMLEMSSGNTDAFGTLMGELESNAKLCFDGLSMASGLEPIEPQGSMYIMVKVDVERLGMRDDMEFCTRLLEEQAVFVLPGECFEAPGFVRIVFSPPERILRAAIDRIQQFCTKHDRLHAQMPAHKVSS